MKRKSSVFLGLLLQSLLLFFPGCTDNSMDNSRIVIGIYSDVETLNPLYAFSPNEGNITGLLFLSLVYHTWNNERGDIDTHPMLANSWEWNDDSTSITLNLRDDVYWSDSIKVTAEDVVFSFDAYSHPDVQSRMYGLFTKFLTDEDNHIMIDSVFKIENPHRLTIKFLPGYASSLFEIDLPIIPKHIFEGIDRKEYSTAGFNNAPVTNGPFKLNKWERNEFISLTANKENFLYDNKGINEIIFKIVPDYNSRLTQLKSDEIDLLNEINPKDAEELKNNSNLVTQTVEGREVEYIAWNNIDPELAGKGKSVPHKLFGSSAVRTALSHAVNAREILDEYLYNFGMPAASPVSPIFKKYINPEMLDNFPHDIQRAKNILAAEGWVDTDRDGVLEKNGKSFSFKLSIPAGKPRREFAAAFIKNNLKEIGIDVEVETLEFGVFIEKLFNKELDAWIASNYMPLPLDLEPVWHSSAPFNLISYSNPKTDLIIEKLKTSVPQLEKEKLLKEFQEIIYKDQPITFLYWISDIVCYNSELKNINVNPLGFVQSCWNWKIEN